ncbi:hypothetical protein AB0A74_09600 [Saccharothrix sp. NPDC042600]|uniref:dTMP kinase n=1 Tax=Saccharothrix TaxID=2071 RepID=UPI0033D33403
MTGLLVAIEGPKYVGKSTVIAQLRSRSADTHDWVFTKEPTDAFDLGNEQNYRGADLARLIADDRARHIRDVIEPALQRGQVVITDRYVLSSFVFHCLDGVPVEVVADLNERFRRPDLLIILQSSAAALATRRASRTTQTRLSEAISSEAEILGYITYASRCRPISGEVLFCYNEVVTDCDQIAGRIIAEVCTKRAPHA